MHRYHTDIGKQQQQQQQLLNRFKDFCITEMDCTLTMTKAINIVFIKFLAFVSFHHKKQYSVFRNRKSLIIYCKYKTNKDV